MRRPVRAEGRLANELGSFLRDNLAFFQGFESVIVYYDNGQALVTDLINTVLCAYLTNVDVRKIAPSEYRLSQTADMVCTLELMRRKSENGAGMSKSELIFFESRRRLSKVFLKTLKGLEFLEELAHGNRASRGITAAAPPGARVFANECLRLENYHGVTQGPARSGQQGSIRIRRKPRLRHRFRHRS